ncbi:MAG: MFS transporter [Spirochaetaceae bacterium]|nr:MFS transporter [Spirochaetaceae bacterium]
MEKLKFKEKFGFGAYSAAVNIPFMFKNMYFLFFLTNVVNLEVLVAGTIVSIGTVWDAINDPLVGYWAVNKRFKSGERVRPIVLGGMIPWSLFTILLFTNFGLKGLSAAIVAGIIYVLFDMFDTLIGIPYYSMAGLATNSDDDRRSINSFRMFGASIGTMVGAVACFPLLNLFGALDDAGNLIPGTASRGFFLTACVMALICIVGSLIQYYTTEERVKSIGAQEKHYSIKTLFNALFSNRAYVLNMCYIICYGVINTFIMTVSTYYATYVLGSSSMATTIQAVFLVANIIAVFIVGPIDKKFGRKKTMMIGALIFILAMIIFLFLRSNPLVSVLVVAVGAGISVTFAYVMLNTNRNEICDLVEWKSSHRIDSMIASADSLIQKLASAAAIQIIAYSLHRAGFNESLAAQPPAVAETIENLISWAPGVLAIAMVLVAFFHPIQKELEKMNTEKSAAAK